MPTLRGGGKLTWSAFERRISDGRPACDLSDLRFVDAWGLVASACSLLEGPAKIARFESPSAESSRRHLTSMGLTRFLDDIGVAHALPAGPAIDAPDVLVPLERVDGRSAERLSHVLWEQLESRADPHVLEGATEGLIELVGNALEHSGQGQAIVMAQVYARGEAPDHDDRLQVVIGDVGRGIRESFLAGPEHRPADDRTAIDMALTYLVSSVPNRGRGQGLTTTAELVTKLQGRMAIRTGMARLDLDTTTHWQNVVALSGTIVGMSMPLYPGA